MDDSQDLFASGSGENTPTEFSGVSATSSGRATQRTLVSCSSNLSDPDDPGEPKEGPSSSNLPQNEFPCAKCKRVLKTHKGYLSHTLLHKVKDANTNKPSLEEVFDEILLLSEEILKEISEDPCLTDEGKQKKSFVLTLMESVHSPNWVYFVEAVAEPLLSKLLERNKVLPSSSYDQNICAFNLQMSEPGFMEMLHDKLSFISQSKDDTPTSIISRVLFRFMNLLFFRLQGLVFYKMKTSVVSAEEPVNNHPMLSGDEYLAFLSSMKKLLIQKLKMYNNSSSAVNRNFARALKEKFVDSVAETVTYNEFLKSSSWVEDDDGNLKIKLSDRAVNFFLSVECLIRSKKDDEKTVFDLLFQSQSEHILNLWSSLTAGHLNEQDALYFLEKITNSIVDTSMNAETSKRVRENERRVKLQKHALRAGLKRN